MTEQNLQEIALRSKLTAVSKDNLRKGCRDIQEIAIR